MVLPKIAMRDRTTDKNNQEWCKTGYFKDHPLGGYSSTHVTTKNNAYAIFKGQNTRIDQTNGNHRRG